MKILNNQRIDNLRPEILLAIRLFDHLYNQEGQELEVTWTTGGSHGEHSLHPKRRAFDGLPPGKRWPFILESVREILGRDYDVVDEGDHIHVEWDPK